MYANAFQQGPPLSITQLVANRTLDAFSASLLWLAVENGLSLVTAAGPSLAGKTTLLESLFVFLHPQRQMVMLRGMEEDFAFLKTRKAEDSFLYCPEISPHLWFYLWGPGVVQLFKAMAQGYPMGATMHADSPEEVIYQLYRGSGVPASLLSRLNLVAVIRTGRRNGRLWRHLDGIAELIEDKDGSPQVRPLVNWDANQDGWRWLARPRELTNRLGAALETELERRRRLLEAWVKEGLWSADDLRRAVLSFYRQVEVEAGVALAG